MRMCSSKLQFAWDIVKERLGVNYTRTIMKILVTGATGYIGLHCVKALLDSDKNYQVRGTVRSLADPEKIKILQNYVDDGKPLELVEADLLNPESWVEACKAVDAVFHVASPFLMNVKESEAEEKLYKPAREGSLSVLRAAKEAGVKRVVLTSSVAAIAPGNDPKKLAKDPESVWAVESKADPYPKSKLYAERAAWEFAKENGIDLTTINPVFVIGPPLSAAGATSHSIVKRFVMREMPFVPDMYYSTIDVRDVALAHVAALEHNASIGERFVLESESTSFLAASRAIAAELNPLGYNVPTGKAPYALLWIGSFFDKTLATVLYSIKRGKTHFEHPSKAERVLGISYKDRDGVKSFVDHAIACILHGTPGFKKTEAFAAKY